METTKKKKFKTKKFIGGYIIMIYFLKTETDQNGELSFTKIQEGIEYIYFAETMIGEEKEVTKNWIMLHAEDILNLGISGDTIYPIEPRQLPDDVRAEEEKNCRNIQTLIDYVNKAQDGTFCMAQMETGGYVIAFHSALNTDCSFYVSGDTAEEIADDIKTYAYDFDVDEYVMRYIEAELHLGKVTSKVSSLVDEARDIEDTLIDLADELPY